MRTIISLLIACCTAFHAGLAQQQYYDVTVGNGNGVRFWQSDSYKIHMGAGAEYQYGPVTDYSIKMNMDVYNNNGRGWTWGTSGVAPIAALNTLGNMQIAGSFQSTGLTTAGAASVEETILNATNMSDQDFNVRVSGIGAATKRTIIGPSTSGRFSLGVNVGNGNEYLTILYGGNIGIGTTAPDAKLAVKGQIHAQEVKVDLNGAVAPDYVFNNDYHLTSLDSIKKYLDQNKHLPEVPSAAAMEKNGVQLGEMNMLLLKKIEELTLYVIEQNKLISKQNERIAALENKH